MTTATAPQQQATRERTADQAASLFEELLKKQSSAMSQVVTRVFGGDNIDKIRDVLPKSLKEDAERFVKRAALYFDRKTDLQECTGTSKLRCVLEAAELGLSLDGRLCHAVAYNVKYKDQRGREEWKKEAQCQPDYKGLLVVARRSGSIVDAYGDVICTNDTVKHGRNGAKSHFRATFPIGDRGEVIGVYAIVLFEGGRWRYEIMNKEEIEEIRKRSKAKGSGPWVTDYNEMAKKTVLRRVLKLYCNDPGTTRALELDEREYEDDGEWVGTLPPGAGKVRRSALNDRETNTTNGNEAPPASGNSDPAPQTESGPQGGGEAEPPSSDPTETPEPGPGMEQREPGGDDPPNVVEHLSEVALALERKLNDPGIDRKVNADILGQIIASKLEGFEKEHLKGLVKRNTDRLKGKK